MSLNILSGLPGAGKTTVARELARAIGAAHVRVDSIEDEIRAIGRTVIADSVNRLEVTRTAWRAVARQGLCFEVEVRCSDPVEHRRRAEERGSPSWDEVVRREYHGWEREHVVIDTAGRSVDDCVRELRATIGL